MRAAASVSTTAISSPRTKSIAAWEVNHDVCRVGKGAVQGFRSRQSNSAAPWRGGARAAEVKTRGHGAQGRAFAHPTESNMTSKAEKIGAALARAVKATMKEAGKPPAAKDGPAMYRTNLRNVPKVEGLPREDGWVDMQVPV